jgi:hypothetical protein
MVNGTRTHYDAILVVGVVAGVAKCINGVLWVGQSCKEIIGNVSVVLVEQLIGTFKDLLLQRVKPTVDFHSVDLRTKH